MVIRGAMRTARVTTPLGAQGELSPWFEGSGARAVQCGTTWRISGSSWESKVKR